MRYVPPELFDYSGRPIHGCGLPIWPPRLSAGTAGGPALNQMPVAFGINWFAFLVSSVCARSCRRGVWVGEPLWHAG